MPGLVVASVLCVLLGAACAATPSMAQSNGEDGNPGLDLIVRYATQRSFVVWGNGTAFNEIQVEAHGGAAINASLVIKARGRPEPLDHPMPITVQLDLTVAGNGSTLATWTGAYPAGQTADLAISVNGSLPATLAHGTHHLQARLLTGEDDPNPANNDAARVPLRIGAREVAAAHQTTLWQDWLGPLATLTLLAGLLIGRSARERPWAIKLRMGTAKRWARATRGWAQRPAPERARLMRRAWAIGLLGAATLLIVINGRGALAAMRLIDIVLLAATSAGVAWALVFVARYGAGVRTHRALHGSKGGAPVDARAMASTALRKAGRVAVLIALVAAFWQQMALATPLFRWPELASLTRFAVIGLSIGAVYALIAIGYTMVYGVLKFINFAHGEVFIWGGYIAWVLVASTGWLALPVAVIVAALLTGLLGVVIERVAYRPLRDRGRLIPLVTAIAVSLLLASLAQFVFGAGRVSFSAPGSRYRGSELQAWLGATIEIAGFPVDRLAIMIFAASFVLMLALHLFVRYARLGQAMRAVSDDFETARTTGIDVDRVVRATFFIGSALAAVAGILWGVRFSLGPTAGLLVGIKAFTAAVVGGIGNIYGAFLGGFLIGLAENVGGQFIDSRFQNALAFVVLIAFLLAKPRGLIPAGGVVRK